MEIEYFFLQHACKSLNYGFRSGTLLVQETSQLLRPARMSKFAQSFSFNLSYSFSGDIELIPNLFEGMVSIHLNAKTHALDFCFARCEARQDILC